MADRLWLINPVKKRRVVKMAVRKRKRVKRKSYRRNPVVRIGKKTAYASNPRRRRVKRTVSRRRYRRNPVSFRGAPAIRPVLNDVGYAALGFMSTKIVGGFVSPYLAFGNPLINLAVKGGVAYVTAWLVSDFFAGKKNFTPILIGGMAEPIQELVNVYVSPMLPGIIPAAPLSAYPGMAAYPMLEDQTGHDSVG